LAIEQRHPVATDRLASASVMSKVRAALRRVSSENLIDAGAGTYQLRLPAGSWIDVDAARTAIDRAEGFQRRGDNNSTWAAASVAVTITRRAFLPGECNEWVVELRRELDRTTVRGYDRLEWVWTIRDHHSLAVTMAESALAVDPFHEPAWRALISAHVASGNRAEATTAFERYSELMSRELGLPPSKETEETLARGI
jgi:DNA-binding SARP family transcriptional activator